MLKAFGLCILSGDLPKGLLDLVLEAHGAYLAVRLVLEAGQILSHSGTRVRASP